jgi:hypothetical protein
MYRGYDQCIIALPPKLNSSECHPTAFLINDTLVFSSISIDDASHAHVIAALATYLYDDLLSAFTCIQERHVHINANT